MAPHRSCVERLEDYLGRAGVAYELVTHPIRYTAQGVAQVEHVAGRLVAKVVMVLIDDQLAMIVTPATSQVDLDWVRDATGAGAVRLAREDEFRHLFPDCELGAMPPFGHFSLIRFLKEGGAERAGSASEDISNTRAAAS